jgi:hypothetical protein
MSQAEADLLGGGRVGSLGEGHLTRALFGPILGHIE